jgi:hypothetical protein
MKLKGREAFRMKMTLRGGMQEVGSQEKEACLNEADRRMRHAEMERQEDKTCRNEADRKRGACTNEADRKNRNAG